MGSEHTVLIKVYSGPHAGAEIRLRPGRYVLGRAADCDIVLNDAAVAEHHLELTAGASGVTVRPLAIPVYYEGQEIDEAALAIGWHRVVTLGTTHFCCGCPDQEWPAVHLPRLRVTQPAAARPGDPGAAEAPAGHSAMAGKPSATTAPARHRLTPRSYSFGGISLLFVCGLLVFSMGNTHPVRLLVDQPGPAEQARYLAKRLGLEQIQVSETGDHKLIKVTGYVENATQKTALQEALRAVNSPLQQHIWVADDLAGSAEAVLEALGIRDLRIKASTVGELILQGYVGDEALWRTGLNTLRQDIPGILAIDDGAVETAALRAEQLRAWLREESLDGALTVAVAGDRLVVKGTLGGKELLTWGKVQHRFRDRYGHHPVVEAHIRETRDAIELDVKSVSVGATAFLVTKDGQQYMTGARLSNGYFIKSIEHDRIVLTRDHRDYAYYLGGK
jgi:type III secretion protein D